MRAIGWIVLALAGCAAATPQAPLVPSQMRTATAAPPASGINTIEVRAFAAAGGVATEATGANCTLSSPYSTAAFVAPASVSVPDFGAATPPVRISCDHTGRKGSLDVAPMLRSTNGLAGWPAIGVSVGTGGNVGVSVGGFWNGGFGTGPEVQRVIYPDARVMMQ